MVCRACQQGHHKGCLGFISIRKRVGKSWVFHREVCGCHKCRAKRESAQWDHNPKWASAASHGFPVDHIKWRGPRTIENKPEVVQKVVEKPEISLAQIRELAEKLNSKRMK